MSDTATKIKPDYTQPWERGAEYVWQEGTGVWQKLREDAGLTREQFHEATDWFLHPARQELIEDALGWPEYEELEWYARLAGTSPGRLLDRIFEEKGRELIAEDADIDTPSTPPTNPDSTERQRHDLDLRVLPMHKDSATYSLPGHCTNCAATFTLLIPRRELAPGKHPTWSKGKATCSNCGCMEVVVDA